MSAATAGYAVFALSKPRHLGAAVVQDPSRQASFDLVARTYGVRDLPISAIALLSRDPGAVRGAMLTRIALDVADGLVLSREADTSEARTKVLGVTLGWASLNALALAIDLRRR